MEVKIGVVHTPKELTVDLDDQSADGLMETVEGAIAGKASVLWITDRGGRRIGVPSDKVAYVELIVEDEARQVGFGVG